MRAISRRVSGKLQAGRGRSATTSSPPTSRARTAATTSGPSPQELLAASLASCTRDHHGDVRRAQGLGHRRDGRRRRLRARPARVADPLRDARPAARRSCPRTSATGSCRSPPSARCTARSRARSCSRRPSNCARGEKAVLSADLKVVDRRSGTSASASTCSRSSCRSASTRSIVDGRFVYVNERWCELTGIDRGAGTRRELGERRAPGGPRAGGGRVAPQPRGAARLQPRVPLHAPRRLGGSGSGAGRSSCATTTARSPATWARAPTPSSARPSTARSRRPRSRFANAFEEAPIGMALVGLDGTLPAREPRAARDRRPRRRGPARA